MNGYALYWDGEEEDRIETDGRTKDGVRLNRMKCQLPVFLSICSCRTNFVYMFGCFRTWIILSVSLSVRVSMYVSICVCVSAAYYASECTPVYLSACLSVCVFLYIWLCLCVHAHLSIWLFIIIYWLVYTWCVCVECNGVCVCVSTYIYLSICVYLDHRSISTGSQTLHFP